MSDELTLITGATSGIGRALAGEFARNGHPLILVAENETELGKVSKLIEESHSVSVTTIAKDLTDDKAPQEIYDELKKKGLEVDVLVNNAGVGWRADFAEMPEEKMEEMIRLDVFALTRLTRLFLPDMLSRGTGRILNTGSVAGYQPGPSMAVYHASKAFVNSLTDSLVEELKDTNVTVTLLAPGPVDTNFFDRADMPDAKAHDPKLMMSPEQVAREAHEGTMKGEHVVMPGLMNKAMTFSRRLMSKEMQAKLQKQFYESKEE